MSNPAGGVLTADEVCRRILGGRDLASKLTSPRGADGRLLPFSPQPSELPTRGLPPRGELVAPERDTPDSPAVSPPSGDEVPQPRGQGRSQRLPRAAALASPVARVQCLLRFAHHELQAIELFAWALLAYPGWPLGLRRALLLTLEEEQRHLGLYLARVAALGGTPDDTGGPLADYLWQHHAGIERASDPAQAFLCALGLTFEQANLDFALLYRDLFREAGDPESAALMQRVHDDEIRHVRLASRWLRRLKRPEHSEAEAYLESVPFPLSAARAKGRRFDLAGRRQAGLSDALIELVRTARPYDERQAQRAAEFGAHAQTGAVTLDRPAVGSGPAAELGAGSRLYLLPNLGAEEDRPVPATARGFLVGLYGAWAALFDASDPSGGPPILLPPGEPTAQARFRQALGAERAGPALPCLVGSAGLCAWLGHEQAALVARTLDKPLAGPRPEVVRRVNDTAFAQEQAARLGLVPPCLAGLIETLSPEELADPEAVALRIRERVAGWPAWVRGRFVLKPRLGTSGRGRVLGTTELTPGRAVREGLRLLAARGGAVLEPWLVRTRDLSLQLFVTRAGAVEVLGSTRQILTPGGQILGNRGLVTEGGALTAGVEPAEEEALRAAGQALGAAAAAAGFFGVCGIDAFSFLGPDGAAEHLRPVVELNARFTTGTVALGLVRRAQAAGLCTEGTAWALLVRAPADLDALGRREGVRCLAPVAAGPILLLARDERSLEAALALVLPGTGRPA